VLEDTFRTGVVNELPAGDESFLHWHFAPRAEAVGEIGGGRYEGGSHGLAFSMRVKNLVNRSLSRRPQKKFIILMQMKKIVV
jgi:hypothetical protein